MTVLERMMNGVCNGPGSIYECGCAEVPEGQVTVKETNWVPLVWRILRG